MLEGGMSGVGGRKTKNPRLPKLVKSVPLARKRPKLRQHTPPFQKPKASIERSRTSHPPTQKQPGAFKVRPTPPPPPPLKPPPPPRQNKAGSTSFSPGIPLSRSTSKKKLA